VKQKLTKQIIHHTK
jgi:dihydrofolate reductase